MVAFGKSSGGGRRVGKREAAPLVATFTTRHGTYRGILVNVSTTGARIRSDNVPSIGEEGALTIEKVKTFCTIRWREDGEFGVEFDQPLSTAEETNLRREVARGKGLPADVRAALDDWTLGLAR